MDLLRQTIIGNTVIPQEGSIEFSLFYGMAPQEGGYIEFSTLMLFILVLVGLLWVLMIGSLWVLMIGSIPYYEYKIKTKKTTVWYYRFPILKYKRVVNSNTECSICLTEFKRNTNVRVLPCSIEKSHSYHVKCIDTWFVQHQTCPICRTLFSK
jgi:hypothetical protein